MGEHPETSVPALRRLARGLLFDAHGAEDVVQEAWLAALGVQPPAPHLGAWLSETVKRLALNRRRAERRRRAREESVARPEALPGADERAEQLELLHRLLDALGRLDEPYRSAVMLRYLDDLPPRAIARRLGVPVNTVRTHVRRGLERLRRDLDGERGRDRQELLAALAPFAGEVPSSVFPWGATTRGSWLLVAAGLLVVLGAWATLRAVLGASEPGRSNEPTVAVASELEPKSDTGQPARRDNAREPAGGSSAAMTANWIVTGHAFRGEDEPFPHLPLIGRVYAGSKAEGTPLVEQRFATDDAGDFTWATTPPTDLVYVSVEPEIEGHVTASKSELFVPGDPAPERWVVWASPLDALIEGTLRDVDGHPIAGVNVWSFQDQKTVSDDNGYFRLRAASSGPFGYLALRTRAPGFAEADIPVEPRPGEIRLPDVTLRPELPIHGRVVDESGNAVANARIGLELNSDSDIKTGEDGTFQLGGFSGEDEYLFTPVFKDGYVPSTQQVPRDAWHSEIEIRLQRGVRVTGRVVASDNEPIWASLVLVGRSPIEAEMGVQFALSDREGCFTLESVPPGKQRFWLKRTGHATTFVDREIPSDMPTIQVELPIEKEHFIAGVVVDEQGNPAPWTKIHVTDERRAFLSYDDEYSGPDGRFRIGGLPDRSFDVQASSGGLVRSRQTVTVDRDDLVLRFRPTSSLAGRVLDADTGDPVPSFSVRPGFPPPDLLDEAIAGVIFPHERSVTNPDGVWTIETANDPGAAFSLEIEADGYVLGTVALVRTASVPSPDDLVIRLARSTVVRGRVIAKESGAPLDDVRLRRITAGQELDEPANSFEPSFEATSDASGRFELAGVPTGEMLLAVEAPGRALLVEGPFVVGATPIERTIEVALGATVRGCLLEPSGNALSGETVSLEARGGYRPESAWSTKTKADGSFLFEHLAPGTYGLAWYSYRGEQWTFGLSQVLEVDAEERVEILLQPKGRAAMHGTLEFDGELSDAYAVWIKRVAAEPMDLADRTSWFARTQGNRFEVERLEPGEYEVSYECVLDEPDTENGQTLASAYGETRVIVPAEGSVEVHLKLERHED